MTAKDRLTPKTKEPTAMGAINVNAPPVRVRMPEIKIPEIKMPEINVPAADMTPVAAALSELARVVAQITQQQAVLTQAIQALASREASVNVAPAQVTVQSPKRPSSYHVELIKDGDETVGMEVVPRNRR